MDRAYQQVTVGADVFIVDTRYQNLKPIGKGSYGLVCSAVDMVTGHKVAIKKVRKVFRDLIDAKRILREIKLLRHFNGHENVINIKDLMTQPPNTTEFEDMYIVTTLMETDLDRIISSKQSLTDQHFHYFLYQLLRGLKYVHSAHVLHRDLKPSNLLVNANCDLAICDFGLARGVDNSVEEKLTEYVQTRWYRAPELLCDLPHYDEKADMWSVGCIFAEMLRRKPFFRGDSPSQQLETIVSVVGLPSQDFMSLIPDGLAKDSIIRGAHLPSHPLPSYFPRDTNPVALDLLGRLLKFDPSQRLPLEEALQHPYLSNYHAQMQEPTCGEVFDSDFEAQCGGNQVIPQRDLQMMMFNEMQELLADPQRSMMSEGTTFSSALPQAAGGASST